MYNVTENIFNQPLVSVIVTSFNQSETIIQTLESILSQKCNFPFEIIIGDDCSIDSTRDICTKYQKQYPKIIHLVFHKNNIGIAANWVFCIKQAHGKYIAACAADDYWSLPSKLQIQIDLLEQNPKIGLCYTDYDILNSDLKNTILIKSVLKNIKYPGYEGNDLLLSIFKGKVIIATHTVCFRKELFDKYLPTDDFIKYKFPIEDWPTWLILSKFCTFKYLPLSTAVYRKGHESLSNPNQYEKIEKKYAEELVMYKYLCKIFPNDLLYNETDYINYVKGILLNLAYKKSDFPAAKKYAHQLTELGSNWFKVKIARFWLTFKLFALFKRILKKPYE